MNIFITSKHPKNCARHLDDKRLNKMILETTQIICGVFHKRGYTQPIPYKPTHINHPAIKWADDNWTKEEGDLRNDRINWLYELGLAYGDEIIKRRGRKHACHLVLEGLTLNFGDVLNGYYTLEVDELFNGARHKGLGLDFTHLPTVEAYRAYLSARWPNDKRKPVWTKRGAPSWYKP